MSMALQLLMHINQCTMANYFIKVFQFSPLVLFNEDELTAAEDIVD